MSDSSPPIRRSAITYGRRKSTSHSSTPSLDLDASATTLFEPSSSNSIRLHDSMRSDLDDEMASGSDYLGGLDASDATRFGDDSQDKLDVDAIDKPFEFEWKKKLRHIDDDLDIESSQRHTSPAAGSSSPRLRGLHKATDASPSTNLFLDGVDAPESSLLGTDDAFSATLPPPSPPVTQDTEERSIERSPARARLPKKRAVVMDSDSDEELPSRLSGVVDTHKSCPPSTSPEDESSDNIARPSKALSKGKGKGKVIVGNVTPLVMEEADLSSTAVSSNKRKGVDAKGKGKDLLDKRTKIKKPTKKELKETRLEKERITADREVHIEPTTKPPLLLSDLLAKHQLQFRGKSEVAIARVPSLSDPIQDFSSSPTGGHSQALWSTNDAELGESELKFGSALGLTGLSPAALPRTPSPISHRLPSPAPLRTSPGPSAYDENRALASDSEDDMPDVSALLSADRKKRKDAENLRLAKEIKMRAVANKKPEIHPASDEDDLQVVHPQDQRVVAVRPTAAAKTALRYGVEYNPKGRALSGSDATGRLRTKNEINRELREQVDNAAREATRKKEEDWIRRGGKLKEMKMTEGRGSALEEWLDKGRKVAEVTEDDVDADDEGSDGEWQPEEEGDENTQAQYSGSEDENARPQYFRSEDEAQEIVVWKDPEIKEDEPVTEDEGNAGPRPPRRVLRPIVDSDDENNAPGPSGRVLVPDTSFSQQFVDTPSSSRRSSTSSFEADKENWIYERSEDEENNAVARPRAIPPMALPLFGAQRRLADSISYEDTQDNENQEPKGPFLSAGGDDAEDPFACPSPTLRSTLASPLRIGRATPGKSRGPSPRVLDFSRGNKGFSQFSDDADNGFDVKNDENAGSSEPKLVSLLPAFSELFEPTAVPQQPEASTSAVKVRRWEPVEVWRDEEGTEETGGVGLNQLRGAQKARDLSLTLDTGLLPALEIGSSRRRQLDAIFEKEQEFVVRDARPKQKRNEELYVNDYGFLTQTRPDEPSPEVYHVEESPSAPFNVFCTQEPESEPAVDVAVASSKLKGRAPLAPLRIPLGTLLLVEDLDPTQPRALRRLRRRSISPVLGDRTPSPGPSRPRNIIDVPKAKKAVKAKLQKSEFVEVEAHESDEDAGFGFGRSKAKEDDESGGEDDDKVVEGLVDDAQVDEQTELVIEKFKEHQEADDREVEQLHMKAVQGQLRVKRRDRGLDFEDSDSEDEGRQKVKPLKRRKIEGDNLEALGQDENTRPFYEAYRLEEDENEFVHLRVEEDVVMGSESDEEEEKAEIIVGQTDLRDEIRAAIRENKLPEHFNPEDVSYVDGNQSSDDDDTRVKIVDTKVRRQVATKGQTEDLDLTFGARSRPVDERDQIRLEGWADGLKKSKVQAGASHLANGATVTGFGRAKKGGGSVRPGQSSSSAAGPSESRPKPAKKPSVLSAIAQKRKGFEG